MVIYYTIGVIIIIGVIRVIATPKQNLWQTLLHVIWLDLLIDLVERIVEFIDDIT